MNEQDEREIPQEEEQEKLPEQEKFYRAPARFGNVPVETEPKGWDRYRQFQKIYPRLDLPMQIVERIDMNGDSGAEPNRLIWGDNLHVMRQMRSNSIDLIYIDPPFFSGRVYNVIWGDENELRSFNDIWEGGLDGYLIWLNARLYEMKRILKETGSIYVHCDWHASHYIKVEMDKIFGYDNFQNEIVWKYGLGGSSPRFYSRKHDILLFYSKTSNYYFDKPREKATSARMRGQMKGIIDVWDIPTINNMAKERIGYPTQKPENLLERVIKASSSEGDVVADFFGGGGGTAAVAQKLGRRFIICDQSRVAVAVTAERLKQTKNLLPDTPDIQIEHWGVYEAERLTHAPPDQFRAFALSAYGAKASKEGEDPNIHGWRNRLPVWVGAPEMGAQATAEDVSNFAKAIVQTIEYRDSHLRDGVMLAWGFSNGARQAASQLLEREALGFSFVKIQQIQIGGIDFRKDVVGKSTDRADYSEFLTFIHPPVVSVGMKALGGRNFTFDAGDTAVMNPGAEIVNVQWDFNYDGRRFTADPNHLFKREGSGKNRRAVLTATLQFAAPGAYKVACRVQDSLGGEGMAVLAVEA